jgi:hypothetical protein
MDQGFRMSQNLILVDALFPPSVAPLSQGGFWSQGVSASCFHTLVTILDPLKVISLTTQIPKFLLQAVPHPPFLSSSLV